MAWLKRGQRKEFVASYSEVGLVCAVNVDFGFSEQVFSYDIKFATKLCFHFAVILVSKKRYNVDKRITRLIFADYLSSYY